MRIVTIKQQRLKGYTKHKETLHLAERPCALILKLNYKGHNYDFAVPIRSNIHPSSPKDEYFPLPPRSKTKPKHRHGVHYIKMFPVDKTWTDPFHVENNISAALMKGILDRNEKQIITECQAYLRRYENGLRSPFATDIDALIEYLNEKRSPLSKRKK